jgi:protein involved in polysaccharide export with SLBB domain
MKLADALASAGGLTEGVSQTVKVIHSRSKCLEAGMNDASREGTPGKLEVYNLIELLRGDEKANPYLQPGDVIVVVELPLVYVSGRVKQPREIFLRTKLTLRQAIEMAGRELPGAEVRRVRIYRSTSPNSENSLLTFDLEAIRKHRARDPVLDPYDIIEVPPSAPRTPMHTYPTFDSRPLTNKFPQRAIYSV